MGSRIGPKKVHRHSIEFKLTAVKLSRMPGVEVRTVAEALDVHPIMLSRWRKEVRDGRLKGRADGWSYRSDQLASSGNCRPSSGSTRCSARSMNC